MLDGFIEVFRNVGGLGTFNAVFVFHLKIEAGVRAAKEQMEPNN